MGRVTILTVIAAATLLVAACGGGDGGGGGTTISITSTAALDGWVQSNGVANSAGGGPLTGDFDFISPNVGDRQFFSFDLSGIPVGAVVTNATLQLHQVNVTGNPFATHGVVIADHLDYGAALDPADFGAAALTANIGTLAPDATVGVKVLNVTTQVQADRVALRTRSQYRIRFSLLDTDNDGAFDYTQFNDGENSVGGTLPVLVVTFQ